MEYISNSTAILWIMACCGGVLLALLAGSFAMRKKRSKSHQPPHMEWQRLRKQVEDAYMDYDMARKETFMLRNNCMRYFEISLQLNDPVTADGIENNKTNILMPLRMAIEDATKQENKHKEELLTLSFEEILENAGIFISNLPRPDASELEKAKNFVIFANEQKRKMENDPKNKLFRKAYTLLNPLYTDFAKGAKPEEDQDSLGLRLAALRSSVDIALQECNLEIVFPRIVKKSTGAVIAQRLSMN